MTKYYFPCFDGFIIDEKINVSSCASCQSFLHSFFLFGLALAIIRIQCFVSVASFLQSDVLCRKSFFDTAPSASI